MPADNKAVRRYHAGIERALGLFDATSEWADFIAYLSRLLKSLQDAPPDVDLPMKGTIARHLAQCLRPSLPSGVHQKALDVYALIFTIIGAQGLARDLSLYLPGLSHTLSFASLSTRPQLLSLYDDHILELSVDILRPAVRAIILSLLPGLEEESGDDFEKTLATFTRLRMKYVDHGQEEIFWQNLFLASITAPNRRAGVLVYLTKHLPKMPSSAESSSVNGKANENLNLTKSIVKPEPGLLVRCFATGLQDDQPLIQRGFLDLLVTHLPLDAVIFHGTNHTSDLDVLVRAAATVVLRRDMSLNRRLWAWFSGSESKAVLESSFPQEQEVGAKKATKASNRTTEYFTKFGLHSLVRGIHVMLDNTTKQPAVKAQPFRIALSLMDRWEIGGPVVEAVFVPLIQCLQSYQVSAPSQEAFDEVFRSANVFFDGIEGRLVTSQILRLLGQSDLDLIYFILSNFNFEDDEMGKRHIPLICLCIAQELHDSLTGAGAVKMDTESEQVQEKLAQILDELLRLINADVLVDADELTEESLDDNWRDRIDRFYELRNTTTKSFADPLTKSHITGILVSNICEAYLLSMQQRQHAASYTLMQLTSGIERCLVLTKGCTTLNRVKFTRRLLESLRGETASRRVFEAAISATRLIATLRTHDEAREAMNDTTLSSFVPLLTHDLWILLHPSTPQYHVEASESIWRLHNISAESKLVESTVVATMVADQTSATARRDSLLRFASLWTHARTASRHTATPLAGPTARSNDDVPELLRQPLLLLIDNARADRSDESLIIWVRSLNSPGPLFRVTLDAANEDPTDPQILGIALERLSHLIVLVRSSPNLWQSFCEQPSQAAAVLELCSLILSKEKFANTLGIQALELIQSMVKNGQYQIGADFTRLLITQFAATGENVELQGSLLGTLQAVFALSAGQQMSELLLPILLENFANSKSDGQIDKYVALMCSIVPSLTPATLMANLLKITSHLCQRLEAYFSVLQQLYNRRADPVTNGEKALLESSYNPDRSIPNLLAGMEYILARAHHQASASSEQSGLSTNSSVVDLPSARASANDHLTVVLCMQDVLKSCVTIWLWRASGRGVAHVVDPKSLHYMSSKLRSRTRRILENLIEAEPQECLETLMGLWVEKQKSNGQHGQILELLQTLDGARPKFMMPTTFNAIYNRTNPATLDKSQRSSLSVNVNAFELIAFLNDYASALEDDLLDEIWGDCTTFLKEILANPMPHRQILLKLLEFVAVLCFKMDNTNFGEESRMRKELADMCARLFTAIFTIKPNGFDGSGSPPSETEAIFNKSSTIIRGQLNTGSALQILHETLPDLISCLSSSDRLMPVYIGIATNMVGPMLHAKTYPSNVSPELLALIQTMSSTPSATRAWRKDTLDAFNDARFLQNSHELVELGWLPLIRQMILTDKGLITELLNRLVPPAAAGLMFGVGATAARTEADKRTQLTLRRIILVMLSMETDSFVPQLQTLFVKLQELLTATADSSPSSTTRTDIYLTFRGILLCFSQSQLSALWPILDAELRDLCTDMLTLDTPTTTTTTTTSKYTMQAKLQGAKLLDVLLLLKPDEFQLHEWLFVTDTVDAIYPPSPPSVQQTSSSSSKVTTTTNAFADQIGFILPGALNTATTSTTPTPTGDNNNNHHHHQLQLQQQQNQQQQTSPEQTKANLSVVSPFRQTARKPWLCTDDSRDPDKVPALLAAFYSQLSIRAFEGNYSLQKADLGACRKDLIADLFAEA